MQILAILINYLMRINEWKNTNTGRTEVIN